MCILQRIDTLLQLLIFFRQFRQIICVTKVLTRLLILFHTRKSGMNSLHNNVTYQGAKALREPLTNRAHACSEILPMLHQGT